jgi:hypothetical protein
MAETNQELPPRVELSKSQSMVFPRRLRAEADNGHPFIQFTISAKDKPEEVNVFLYQPPGVGIQDGASYTNFDLGALQGAQEFGQSVAGGKTVADSLNASDMMAAGLIGQESLSQALGSDLVGKGTAIGALKSGIATNPYTRVSFEGVNIRTYDFTFKLVPEDEKETEEAKRIERTFRKFLYPKRVGAIALTYPPMFKIGFYSGRQKNPYMPNIKDCYLTSLQTTFNESTNAVFKGTGAPIEVSIAMTFQEERTLVRQDLYENDDTIEERDGYFSGGG